MPTRRRARVEFLALATLAATTLTGCASRAPRCEPSKDPETRFFADSTSWLGGDRCVAGESSGGTRPPVVNPAMRPVDPWVGAVGLKFGVVHKYEMGVGLCVPSPGLPGGAAAPIEVDRVRQVAAGVWLKFDF